MGVSRAITFGPDVGPGIGAAQTDLGTGSLALVIRLATQDIPSWPPVDSTQRNLDVPPYSRVKEQRTTEVTGGSKIGTVQR